MYCVFYTDQDGYEGFLEDSIYQSIEECMEAIREKHNGDDEEEECLYTIYKIEKHKQIKAEIKIKLTEV